jgi:PB1 domain
MSSHSLFKFTKDGVTRRVTLSANVPWLDVASKIETLYNIPMERVGVSYVDSDGDEITISTQEELQDYYRARGPSSSYEFIKLTVVDLDSLRAVNDKPLPDTPHPMPDLSSRNTFGTIPMNLEEGWHAIPGFDLFASSSGSMRFEELASEAGSRIIDGNREKRSVASSESASTVTPKNRSSVGDDEISSIDSVIGNDTPKKPPVHVYNRQSSAYAPTSIPANRPESRSISTLSSPDVIPDPPLPELEPLSAASHSPSLTGDVAALLSTITTVFSSHPELAEGLRNIFRNVGNGAYWDVHRERAAHAAEQIRRSTQDLRAQVASATAYGSETEQQASRRIAEAIGNIIRSLGQMALDPNTRPATSDERQSESEDSRPTLWSVFGYPLPPLSSQHSGVPPPPEPPHLPHPPHPPRPPRGHPFHPPHRPLRPHFPFGHWGGPMGPPPPPPPPPPPHGPYFPWLPPPGNNAAPSDISDDDISEAEDAEISMYGVTPMLSPQAQREKVQAAKAAYKAEKEKYRQEKRARRMARDRTHHPERLVSFLT